MRGYLSHKSVTYQTVVEGPTPELAPVKPVEGVAGSHCWDYEGLHGQHIASQMVVYRSAQQQLGP